jgi:hypothetical protein
MAVTTRLGLFKPAGTDLVDRVADLNNNWDLIDSKAGRVVCTSATRPTGGNLYNGLPIYETDTGNFYTYDSGAAAWKAETAFNGTSKVSISANLELGWGSIATATNASGDIGSMGLLVAAMSWSTCYMFLLMNGDGITRANCHGANTSSTFPAAGGINTRWWLANTGAVVASASVRWNFIAVGK